MSFKQKNSWLLVGTVCVLGAALSGCSTKDDELRDFIEATKKEDGGKVQGVPEITAYETYAYESSDMRSPFMPGGSGGPGQVRPDVRRNPEFLENFSLDTLRMVGTLRLAHRVLPGNYMGQASGKVVEITPSKISVVEIVPDGAGGYMERPAALVLN
jgi:type IV pilus assembly protein PilP